MIPNKRIKNDSVKPIDTVKKLADDDIGDHFFDQSPKTVLSKTDSGNGESGLSLSHDCLSTGSGGQFSDYLISPSVRSPDLIGRPESVSDITSRAMSDSVGQKDARGRDVVDSNNTSDNNVQKQLAWMQRNLDMLKQENAALERALAGPGGRPRGDATPSGSVEPGGALLLSNFKAEMSVFRAELSRVNASLGSCDLGRAAFFDRWTNNLSASFQQINDSLKDLLQNGLENPVDKVLFDSLQSRLTGAQEILKKNRADMTDDLSKVEESLLVENVKCKISESEMKRKVEQLNGQIRAMRKNQQGVLEVCQRLKVRSSENGFIDVQEILKRMAVDDTDKRTLKEDEVASRDLLQEVKADASKQIAAVVGEKQLVASELGSVRDEFALTRLENDRLKKSLNEFNAAWESDMEKFKKKQNDSIGQILLQMESFINEVKHLCRCDEASNSTVKILEDVLDTKERLLSAALDELERVKVSVETRPQTSKTEEPSAKAKQHSDQLDAILEFMKAESANQASARLSEDPPPINSGESSASESFRLSSRCSKLELELEFAEKNLEFEKMQIAALQSQLNSCQDDLRQKTQALEVSTSNEADLKREMNMLKEWLESLNAQLIDKEKELKLKELDQGSVKRLLEKDGPNFEGATGDDADIKFIKQALELDLMSSRSALDSCLKENLALKKSLEQATRDLAAERDVTSSATYDKILLQQQLFTSQQERDQVVRERDELQRKLSLLQLENQKLASSVSRNHNLSDVDADLQGRIKTLTTEMSEMKKKLDAKERDVAFLRQTLKFILKSNEASVLQENP